MNFYEWMQHGMDSGFCSDGVCDTHEGLWEVLTDEAQEAWEEGGDPCIGVVRIWPQEPPE